MTESREEVEVSAMIKVKWASTAKGRKRSNHQAAAKTLINATDVRKSTWFQSIQMKNLQLAIQGWWPEPN